MKPGVPGTPAPRQAAVSRVRRGERRQRRGGARTDEVGRAHVGSTLLELLRLPREAHVGEPRVELAVEQDVARLDVAVDDHALGPTRRRAVQVDERARRVAQDAQQLAPAERRRPRHAEARQPLQRLGRAQQAVGEAAARHEGIHEARGAALEAVAEQGQQALVPAHAEHVDLVHERLSPPRVFGLQALDRTPTHAHQRRQPVRRVDDAEAPAPQLARPCEARGRASDLRGGEKHGQPSGCRNWAQAGLRHPHERQRGRQRGNEPRQLNRQHEHDHRRRVAHAHRKLAQQSEDAAPAARAAAAAYSRTRPGRWGRERRRGLHMWRR